MDTSKLTVTHNTIDHQFETVVGEHKGLIAYRQMGNVIYMTHTEVAPALEGKGVAGKIAQFALDYVREHGLKVVPSCPYVRGYIERHPEYQDLVVSQQS
ncbi:MAG: GNAT family N-acetyltransferase [bacterium]|nr:GNAT family N-acetyltransferase [bacterium]